MTGAYLGVETSATGRRWVGPDTETERLAAALVQQAGLADAVARVLARRGVTPPDAPGYLAPSLRDLMPDPSVLRDMERAAARLASAIAQGQRIAIFADYDVDGACSAALLLDYLRACGLTAALYVPDRLLEGYGPNVAAMEKLAAAHDLIICVDCGTMSHAPIAAASGTDVLVLDHHQAAETLPPAFALVNPNRADEDGTLGHLCAAGVVFLFLAAVNRLRRAAGAPCPDLLAFLDLVALATVADVAPLIGLNRAFVRQGLSVMGRRARPGLTALADVARLDTAPQAHHLGFVLGPRINAGGRVGRADLGTRLLVAREEAEARALADRLDELNEERRAIEAAVRAAALAQAETRGLDAPLVWAAGEGWHAGVVGIVAARLKEAADRPAVVIGFDGETGTGSARSVPGVDLGTAVQRLAAEGLVTRGGGHKMAAGLSLTRAQLEPAMARLSELLSKQGAGQGGPADLRLDGVLLPGATTPDLVESLLCAGPFGAAAPAPRFALPALRVAHLRRMGETHLRATLAADDGARIEAVAFGAFDGPLGPFMEKSSGSRLHVAGRIEINDWGGLRRVQLRLEDAAPT